MAIAPIITQLQQAVTGLFYMSETEAPLEVVQWDQKPDDLTSLITKETAQPIETTGLEPFFSSQVKEHDWFNDEEYARAKRFQALVGLLKQHLKDIQVVKVGKAQKSVYVLGRSPDGTPIGLKTTVVES